MPYTQEISVQVMQKAGTETYSSGVKKMCM